MARINTKTKGRSDHRIDRDVRVAGGFGAAAAKQDAESLLRRAVLANLLWENQAYEDGELVADRIRALVPYVKPETVARIAEEARVAQRLRHVPLLLADACTEHSSHRVMAEHILSTVVRRPDEITEFLAIHWDGKEGKISNAAKRGLAKAFNRFDAYQLAKYNQGRDIKLRDALFVVHPTPKDEAQRKAFYQLANNQLPTPDTWEVALSAGKDKKETWERLITDGKLGALAFLRNLRNMERAGVSSDVIRQGFANLRTDWLLPLNFFAAAKASPRWQAEIEDKMLRTLDNMPKLPGHTHLIVDVSGSMTSPISDRSEFRRLDAAAAMAVLAREMCESVTIWATSGDDWTRQHQTTMVRPYRGFALAETISQTTREMGYGGIYTRQCLNYIREHTDDYGHRTIVFSDSQDCDFADRSIPKTFSPRNYIVDVSAHTRGVAYGGVWDAEVSGWSEHFLTYIHALEGHLNLN